MSIYSKKRRSSFNTYKAIRNTILLNKINCTHVNPSKVIISNLLENNWIEQYSENTVQQIVAEKTLSKTNKIVVRWWEN